MYIPLIGYKYLIRLNIKFDMFSYIFSNVLYTLVLSHFENIRYANHTKHDDVDDYGYVNYEFR